MFTLAHLHLLLNHLPIIVTALGTLLLLVAVIRHRDDLARVALAFFVGGGVSALAAYLTGEPAEHTVEGLPGVTEALIARHQDTALVASLVVGLLAAGALWTLWQHRRATALPRGVTRLLLGTALVASGAMAWTGLLGGEIRHTEIRPGFVAPAEGPGAAPGTPIGDRPADRGGR